MGKHFGQAIIGQVLAMREQGYLHREIAEHLGYDVTQIKKLVERYNRKQRERIKIPMHKGRPRVHPLTTQHELEMRIKKLEREVELYRSFLQAAGRM